MTDWRRDVCEFCWHQEDDHEHSADKRTPKESSPGRYVCSDCATCEIGSVIVYA